MTHEGPQDSGTCNANKTIEGPDGALGLHRFGSAGLANLLRKERESLVVNIHGHCHDGASADYVRGDHGFPIINPGSLA